ncbi:hypothetical protein GQR58_025419 [Nymphon striatum]|nr:hypothetical protein GQR58_025419 [Nymphon striatum]
MITLRKESNIPLRTVKVQPFCLFIMPEITKIGDICESDANCTANISGPAYCNSTTEVCSCPESHPVHVKSRKACLEKKDFGEVCTKAEQCSFDIKYSTCEHGTCKCLYLYAPSSDNTTCVYKFPDEPDGIDFAMLGILIGLIFMFIILCVVLQMFSRLWVFLSITHHANRMSRAYVQEQVCPFISVVNPCTISIVEGGN